MKDLSKAHKRAGSLMRGRYRLEKANLLMRDMIKGSLIEHYKKCGRKNCICRKGKLHGPYWYLSYAEADKSVLRYINQKDLARIDRLAKNYKSFQFNITRINEVNREIAKIMGNIRKLLLSRRK